MSTIDRSTDSLLRHLLEAGQEEDAALPAGSKVGRYVVLELLGAGGMSVVYKAYDPQLDRAIALKLMRAAPTAGDSQSDASARLLREAQALAKLAHPNIVGVHDVGLVGQEVFVAMEFVAGMTATAWRKAQARTVYELLEVYAQAGQGLSAAHFVGLVHRDFKPDNVIVGDDGRVRVLDFGLATAQWAAPTPAPAGAANQPLGTRITRESAVVGTPAYMAPEQHRRLEVTERTDQFNFCAALHEALYGQLPFAGSTVDELEESVSRGRVREPPPDSGVPGWIRPILVRGLAVDPQDRFASMDELLGALGKDPRAGRRKLAVAAALVAGIVAVAIISWWLGHSTPERCAGASRELAGIWSSEVKQRVRTAFVGTGNPNAAAAFERVEMVLDGHAANWAALQVQLCRDRTLSRADKELSERCLDRRKGELQELVASFAAADSKVVDSAVHASFELPIADGCTDLASLRLSDSAAAARQDTSAPEGCGVPAVGRYSPVSLGRIWVYDVIDKSTRRSAGDPKVLTVEALEKIEGCKRDVSAFRIRRQSAQGYAYRWQEVREVESPSGNRTGAITLRHRDTWYDADGTVTKEEYYVPARVRLEETCANTMSGAAYLDSYDEVEVAAGGDCSETIERKTRTFDWKVIAVDVPVTLTLDYSNPACCPNGQALCGPPANGPGHRCTQQTGQSWECEFSTLKVQRREVKGGKTATYWFALGVGEVLEDTKGEEREELICFHSP